MIVKVKNMLFRFKIVSEGRILAVALKKVSIERINDLCTKNTNGFG